MNQSDELRGAIAKARLEEAQWWERLVDEEHHDEFLAEGEACIYCEHIAELKAAARQAAESPGRSELVMKLAEWLHLRISAVENSPLNEEEEPCEDCENDAKQFIADNFLRTERSLAEVSADEKTADEIIEACARKADNTSLMNSANVQRVQDSIRALKGTFSLRASGVQAAIEQEHRNHTEFEAELYCILVDPVECSAKNEAEQHEQLRKAALWSRQHIADLENQLNAIRASKTSEEKGG